MPHLMSSKEKKKKVGCQGNEDVDMDVWKHKADQNLLNNTMLCANWSLPWGVLRS